jgi:hypothetical protein
MPAAAAPLPEFPKLAHALTMESASKGQRDVRRMNDQHSLDEAKLRRAQQHAAGDSHRPVEPMPALGEKPSALLDSAMLREGYEAAVRREQEAWQRVQALPSEQGFAIEAWDDWRDAVEARDTATRLLINWTLQAAVRSP